MKALQELSRLGYDFRLEGRELRYFWTGQGAPDPETVGPLLDELKSRKTEALEYLRAQRVASLPLENFSRGFLAVRVFSEILGREVWFVSNEKAGRSLGAHGVVFTGAELALLLQASTTPKDLRAIVQAKESLGCKLVDIAQREPRPSQ